MKIGRRYPDDPKPQENCRQPPVWQFDLRFRTDFHRDGNERQRRPQSVNISRSYSHIPFRCLGTMRPIPMTDPLSQWQ